MNERIMVTGGHGFLGTKLVEVLKHLEPSNPMVYAPTHAECDLLSGADTEEAISMFRPTVLVHLAADCGGIGANRRLPGRYIYRNLQMGLNVIEWARKYDVAHVIMVGSVCAYPEHTRCPFREDDLYAGYPEPTNAAYGLAKRTLLTMLEAYRDQYERRYTYLIPANLYGPGDDFSLQRSHAIPAIIRKINEGHKTHARIVTLWGDGTPTRDFLHVNDCVHGILSAIRHGPCDSEGPINVGTGKATSIREVADIVTRTIGFMGAIDWDDTMPGGQQRRQLDISRATRVLGWEPLISIKAGLVGTVLWWIRYEKGQTDE